MERKRSKRRLRKLLCVITAIAMVMTLMPMSASAATPITKVQIYGIQTPVVGMPTSDEYVSVNTNPENAAMIKDCYWYDNTTDSMPGYEFVAGHEYSMRLEIQPNDGYGFQSKKVGLFYSYTGTTFINGEQILAPFVAGSNLYVVSEPVKAATPVTKVRLTNVPTPVAGLPCATEDINVSSTPANAIGEYTLCWRDITTGTSKESTDLFEDDHVYQLIFVLPAKDGYGFKLVDSTEEFKPYAGSVTVNGVASYETTEGGGGLNWICGRSRSELARPLSATASVSVKLYGHDDIKASWSKVTGATGYKVYCKRSTASSYTYKGTTTGTSKSLANLTDGAKYYVKVVPYATVAGTTVTGQAKVSSGIYTLKRLKTPKISKSSSTKVKVKWNNINGESGYQISKSTKKTGTNIVATRYTTTGTYKVLKAKKYQKYYYKVRAFKTVNGKKIFAPWSSVSSFTLR